MRYGLGRVFSGGANESVPRVEWMDTERDVAEAWRQVVAW